MRFTECCCRRWHVGSDVTQLRGLFWGGGDTAATTAPLTPDKDKETLWNTRVSLVFMWRHENNISTMARQQTQLKRWWAPGGQRTGSHRGAPCNTAGFINSAATWLCWYVLCCRRWCGGDLMWLRPPRSALTPDSKSTSVWNINVLQING